MLRDICLEDVVDSKAKKKRWTPMDYLTEVVRVAVDKYDAERPLKKRLSLRRPQQWRIKNHHHQFLDIPDNRNPLKKRRSVLLRPQQTPMKKQRPSLNKNPINMFLHIPNIPMKKPRSVLNNNPINLFLEITQNQRLISDREKPIKKRRLSLLRPQEQRPMKKQRSKPINQILDIPDNERFAGDQNLVPVPKRKKNGHKKKNKGMKLMGNGPNPPQEPNLPIWMRNRIGEMGGSDIKLVIQKGLFATDLSELHNRLSMPISNVRCEFLTEAEKARLKMKRRKNWLGVDALLIDPELNLFRTKLKRWDMSSPTFALVKPWKVIVKVNNFVEDEVLQVWSFRSPESELCFALVKVPTQTEHDGAIN